MRRGWFFIIVLFFGASSGCSRQIVTEPIYSFTPPVDKVSYTHEVKPILEKRCVVCHSCYNSPCQLKFSSWEGIDRGASKERVYNADRLRTMEPSRLFVDAQTTSDWRGKGFYGVKPEQGSREYDESIMFLLLDHKRKSPGLLTSCRDKEHFLPEAEDLACPKTTAEVNNFLKTHPNRGMPFGFPPLSEKEFNLVVGWLSQGAVGPTDDEQEEQKAIPDADRKWIAKWEQFLNKEKPKHRLTARYLYEHLFLAHIHFRPDPEAFYELVRSKTPPGEKIDIIATRRPYDSPETTQFWYRFRKIHSILVHKTHMVFTMDEKQFNRVEELFIKPQWDGGSYRLTYDKQISANPFESFERIPVRSRYEWLLDNAHYIIMTFIRGPVCKGQVALNVINDHFWLLFMNPKYDVSVKYPDFLQDYSKNLRMPAEEGSGLRLLKAFVFWHKKYEPWSLEYYKARQDKYAEEYQEGLDTEAIWIDKRDNPQSVLTVFRHFDSASVYRGFLGKLPKTAWVVDYPILERIYYALVAGFDVYGTKGHQGSTRKYMDSLRVEAESAFLMFMPPESRKRMMKGWYLNLKDREDLQYHSTSIPATFSFPQNADSDYSKRKFFKHIAKKLNIQFDQNYRLQNEDYSSLPDSYNGFEDWVRGFQAVSEKDNSFIKRVADHNANVAWVRVKKSETESDFFSVLVDRWHDNVKYIKGEEEWLNPAKDEADVISGLVGSYPNYFFEVNKSEMDQFFEILYSYDGSDRDICRLETYGINRAEPQFWSVYDRFQEAFDEQHKEKKGIIDLNRYYSLAMQKELYGGGTEYECEVIVKQMKRDK